MNKITKQQDKKNFNHKGIVFIKKKIINFTEHHKKRAKKKRFLLLKERKICEFKRKLSYYIWFRHKKTHTKIKIEAEEQFFWMEKY